MRWIHLPAILLIAACNRTGSTAPSQWCEFDSTDARVSDTFCLNNSPGYEWEPDGDDYPHHNSGYYKRTTQYQPPAYRSQVQPPRYSPPPKYSPPPAPAYKPPPPPAKTK